jgi:hypothetical protein
MLTDLFGQVLSSNVDSVNSLDSMDSVDSVDSLDSPGALGFTLSLSPLSLSLKRVLSQACLFLALSIHNKL